MSTKHFLIDHLVSFTYSFTDYVRNQRLNFFFFFFRLTSTLTYIKGDLELMCLTFMQEGLGSTLGKLNITAVVNNLMLI